MNAMLFVVATVLLVGLSGAAHAYIGPGLGAGTLAVVAGFFVAVFLAVFGVLWYPLKRLIHRFKARNSKVH